MKRLMKWQMALSLAALFVVSGCKGKGQDEAKSQPAPAAAPAPAVATPAPAAPEPAAKPVPGTVDTAATAAEGSGANVKPVIHGQKWSDEEGEGKGGKGANAGFKETWVYVDGEARGALMFTELPLAMPEAWKDDLEDLDFSPANPGPRYKKIQILRYRLADYLKLIGVDLRQISMVYLHAHAYVAISGNDFRKFAKDITFDITGNNMSKTRFFWPAGLKTNAQFDRYVAVSVFLKRPPLKIDENDSAFIDGVEVEGVPYHGSPERGGIRVYVDNKLAMNIKRNDLGDVGRLGPEKWDLRALLAARGVKSKLVAGDLADELIPWEPKRTRVDQAYLDDLSFTVSSQASGVITVGKDNVPTTALLLYTAGHVPPVKPMPPWQRDWQPPSKGISTAARR